MTTLSNLLALGRGRIRPAAAIFIVLTVITGALLAAPLLGRLVRFGLLVVDPARMLAPSGAGPVVSQTLALPPDSPTDPQDTIAVRVWSAEPRSCASEAAPCPPRSVLLYAPGARGAKTDNSVTAADLASHGYVVVAMDDIEHEANLRAALPEEFNMSSAAALRATFAAASSKVQRQASQASAILDRLAARQARDGTLWPGPLILTRVGFFGWSIGGATAMETAIREPRVAASANMDGWLFGAAAAGGITKPSLTFSSDDPLPSRTDLGRADGPERTSALFQFLDLREKIRIGLRPDSYMLLVSGTQHDSFSDAAFQPSHWRSWLRHDPFRTREVVTRALLAFFDESLKGQRSAVLDTMHPLASDIAFLNDSEQWPEAQNIIKSGSPVPRG